VDAVAMPWLHCLKERNRDMVSGHQEIERMKRKQSNDDDDDTGDDTMTLETLGSTP
jgi:hypothetical protein